MEAKIRALYSDVADGQVSKPAEFVEAEFAANAWKSVALVVETAGEVWAGNDLPRLLEQNAERVRVFREAIEAARRADDEAALEAALLEVLPDAFRSEVATQLDRATPEEE